MPAKKTLIVRYDVTDLTPRQIDVLTGEAEAQSERNKSPWPEDDHPDVPVSSEVIEETEEAALAVALRGLETLASPNYSNRTPSEPCPRCNGTGKLDWTLAPPSLTQFMTDEERERVERICPVCDGTGRISRLSEGSAAATGRDARDMAAFARETLRELRPSWRWVVTDTPGDLTDPLWEGEAFSPLDALDRFADDRGFAPYSLQLKTPEGEGLIGEENGVTWAIFTNTTVWAIPAGEEN
jgi:hypothetical protein